MYSTKYVNKNLVDGNAYISIGDPYKDKKDNVFRSGKPGESLKKFMVLNAPENQENGNFSKVRYEAGPYKEGNLYIESQPLESRKFGFGSHDAHRRDEFSNAVRTEQYRETLRKEVKIGEKNAPDLEEEITRLKAEREKAQSEIIKKASKFPVNDKYNSYVPQYDIGRSRVTPFDPKSIKDTYYKFDTNFDKRFGSSTPTSCVVGECAWEITYKPPNHGGKSEVKNFFDKSHLRVGA